MNRKKWTLLIIIILIIIAYIFLSQSKDDLDLMEKQISKYIKAKQSVLIYNATIIDNHELMSYIQKDGDKYQQVGYAHFIINNKGKYELLNVVKPDKIIEKASDVIIYEFLNLNLENPNLSTNPSIFIISNNPNLARIERIMNNGDSQQKEVINNPSISFFNEGNDKVIEYNLYNQNGDLIK